MNTITDAELAK